LVIIAVFFAVAFLFVFFVVWLISGEEIGDYPAISGIRVEEFWRQLDHAQWYAAFR
jgi:hypothetical protein